MGILEISAAVLAGNNSYLSPSNTIISGFIFLKDLANSITPLLIDLHIAIGVSERDKILILSLIINLSFIISLYVFPNSGER